MSNNNEHPVSPAGLGNEPSTTNRRNPSSTVADNTNALAQPQNLEQNQNLEQKTEDAVTDTKSAEGGENAVPAPSSITNDTTAAASTNATQMTSEEPKEPLSESSAAQAKEVEAPEEEQEEEDSGPSLVITLLLTSGSRHPFKIDGKYLRKQSVNVENNDPFSMSVYTLKELIWREWRSGKDVL